MADPAQHQAPNISSTYPNPPDFLWRDFTPENTSRYDDLTRKWREEHPEAADQATVLIPDLPVDLRHLQPPPEPTDGAWKLYGDRFTLKDELPTLEEMGVPRLAPSASQPQPQSIPAATTTTTSSSDANNRERALNLKRLAKSVLLNFLELIGAASINPDAILDKAADIQTILLNMHHGINEYRPHQARESLIQTMQTRLDQVRAETAAVNAVTDKARRVLEGLGSIEVPAPTRESMAEGKAAGGGEDPAYQPDDEELWDDAAALA